MKIPKAPKGGGCLCRCLLEKLRQEQESEAGKTERRKHMKQLFQETLAVLDGAFSRLEAQVPSPQQIRWRDGLVFRYVEQTIHQAILLKLARMISGLRAALVLLENGFVQEQAVMQRVLDEMGEDIIFLVYAVTNDTVTELHERYLEAFFQEEFDPAIAPIDSPQNRPMIPRKRGPREAMRPLSKGKWASPNLSGRLLVVFVAIPGRENSQGA